MFCGHRHQQHRWPWQPLGWYGANTRPEAASSGFEWSPQHAASGDGRRIIWGSRQVHQDKKTKSCFESYVGILRNGTDILEEDGWLPEWATCRLPSLLTSELTEHHSFVSLSRRKGKPTAGSPQRFSDVTTANIHQCILQSLLFESCLVLCRVAKIDLAFW